MFVNIKMEEMEIDNNIHEIPDTSTVVKKWMKKFKEGTLTGGHFRDHWRVIVPRAFIPEQNTNCLEWAVDESIASSLLINTLEEFICNSDRESFLKYISEFDQPPSVCGKVFKMGEPTYNCRECGMDATCVLCVNCFKQSAHKNHRYKMGTSGGGGCCDCGDVEAWKSEPYCETHLVGTCTPSPELPVQVPEDLVNRAFIVFTVALRYAYQLLTLEHCLGLPSNLKLKEGEELNFSDTELYCTVLYNDETHTFEQVINTLARVIKCSQRDAIDFVTNIDREGRAVVKCSTFQHCTELKSDIERFTSRHGTRPIKVLVVHSHVIAHQMFALRLLTWLQKLTTMAKGFRSIFTSVALQEKSSERAVDEGVQPRDACISIVEGILLRDSLLWKSARLHWHRLFISGMFMEYENKKSFANVFTSHYGQVMKDFIRDDHDHSFSVASLSIQIFTVPTLAQYLIAHKDVLLILLNTFNSECAKKCNKASKLEFDRAAPSGPFKRAIYILYDLRYLLGSPPEVWTDDLRKGFLQGVSLILNLLTYMQGMDSVTRQVGQHMEYEPEWESAFNLHIKLAPVITLILKWCSTDQTVLIKAYRLTLKKLHENPSFDPNQAYVVRELADHSASCLQYDVSNQPVSIHLPLSRFLAGLHLYLEKFNLTFFSHEFFSIAKQTPEQIIEPVLRTQVMIAQVHAGMWRRNGYSLSNQIYFYHNVKCRGEMLDKDIVLLQFGASLIESNEFLIHVLNKFGLLLWASPDFEKYLLRISEEDGMKQTINMVEEFLSLLITITGERYVPGVGNVTPDDCIKNEIIHQLFIKPLSHSELNKTLPDDVNHETGMERVIDEVAAFKKPNNGNGKGVYVVKEDLINKYNVFFYHYTKEELSKSEEEQRKRRKVTFGYECCPPPVLPRLSQSFSMVANLLQCDVMLNIMSLVLERSLNLRARSFSEAQLHKVLHLIGYALHEEEQQYSHFINFTKRAEKWGIEYLLEELCTSQRVDAHKDLIHWTLQKFKDVARPSKLTKPGDNGLITSFDLKMEQQEKEFRAKLAAERRAMIMAQMAALQQNFMKDNAALFQNELGNLGGKTECASDDCLPVSISPVALGANQTSKLIMERTFTCILCQEDQIITPQGPAMVLTAFVQKSTVLCRNRNTDYGSNQYLGYNMGPCSFVSTCGHVMHSTCWKKYIDTITSKENRRPYRLRQPTSFDVDRNEYLCPLCECLNNTVLPVIPPLGALPNNQSNASIDKLTFTTWYEACLIGVKQDRRRCCDSANVSFSSSEDSEEEEEGKHESTQRTNNCEIETSKGREVSGLKIPTKAETNKAGGTQSNVTTAAVAEPPKYDIVFSSNVCIKVYCGPISSTELENGLISSSGNALSDDLVEMSNMFTDVILEHGLNRPPMSPLDVPLVTWKTCAYTIHSVEWLLRYQNKPLFGDFTSRQQDGLENLVRLSGVLGSVSRDKQAINRSGVELLSMVIDLQDACSASVIEWDCFGLLVPLTNSLSSMFYPDPAPVPLGTTLELYALRLMLLCHFVQTIICTDLSEYVLLEGEDISNDDTKCLLDIVIIFKECRAINSQELWEKLKMLSSSFMRCSAIYFHFLTGVPAPEVLKEVGGDSYENICSYLGLSSSCKDFFDNPSVAALCSKWASHPDIAKLRSSQRTLRDMVPLNELVNLPDDYSELINTVSLFTCPNSDREDSRNPTMCLICGEMLCSQTYCCQTELNKTLVGACTFHANFCGAGAGMFLRVRECEVLLLASPNRGCFMAPPYLDDYGEADQGLRRGNPLHLCQERYRKLQLLWLSHSIHEEIARAIESSHSHINTQWQHL